MNVSQPTIDRFVVVLRIESALSPPLFELGSELFESVVDHLLQGLALQGVGLQLPAPLIVAMLLVVLVEHGVAVAQDSLPSKTNQLN